MTFSGGEPFAQPEFLEALIKEAKFREIDVAVDTCGQVAWETIDAMRDDIDLFLYDLKIMDDARHKEETGASNKRILTNLKKLSAAGENILIRIPVISSVNDDEENFRMITEFILSLENKHPVQILPYHETGSGKYDLLGLKYRLEQIKRPDPELMGQIAGLLQENGIEVSMGGSITNE